MATITKTVCDVCGKEAAKLVDSHYIHLQDKQVVYVDKGGEIHKRFDICDKCANRLAERIKRTYANFFKIADEEKAGA